MVGDCGLNILRRFEEEEALVVGDGCGLNI